MQQANRRPSLFDTFKLLISASFKGFSQVLLVDNAISGSLILLGITLHSPILGLMTFISSIIGTVIGKYFGGDLETVQKGIYGFNSILAGLAVMLFLTDEIRWTIVFIAATAAALFQVVLKDTFNIKKIPILTVPFAVVTWIGLILAYRIEKIHLNAAFVITSPTKWNLPAEGTPNIFVGLVKGIGEVFLIDSLWTGSLIFIALLWAGWRYGVYAMTGSFLSWLTAYSIGVDTELLDLGLYNYNAVLTMIAVGLMFDEKKRNFPLTGIFAAIMTVPVAAFMDMLLEPFGLPALTTPFIITTWMFLVIRKYVPKLKL